MDGQVRLDVAAAEADGAAGVVLNWPGKHDAVTPDRARRVDQAEFSR